MAVLSEFLAESAEHLEGIEDKVLKLEVSKDSVLINSIFRPIHTIKGTSSFLGLTNICQLSHEVETLLDDIRKERITDISSVMIDVLLESIDMITRMLANTAAAVDHIDSSDDDVETEIVDIPCEEIAQRLNAIRSEKTGAQELPIEIDNTHGETTNGAKTNTKNTATHELPFEIHFPGDMKLQYEVESGEQIAVVEQVLLELEKSPLNFDLYNDLFRALHSLKGNTGVILSVIDNEQVRLHHYLNRSRDMAHRAESIVQKRRDGKQPLNEIELDILLNAADCMKNFLNSFKTSQHWKTGDCPELMGGTCEKQHLFPTRADGDPPPTGCPMVTCLDEISATVSQFSVDRLDTIKEIGGDSLAEAVTNSLEQVLEAIEGGLNEITQPSKRQNALKKLKRSYKNLIKIGTKINHDFLLKKAEGGLRLVEFMCHEQSSEESLFIHTLKAEWNELHEKADRRLDKVIPDRRKATLPPPTADISRDVEAKISDKILKVSQEKIDIFMNLIGELLVSKNSLNSFEREVSANYDLPEIAKRLKDAVGTIARISNDLQTNIMDIRMLPVANAFARFPRMVRDLSKKLQKKIKLEITGEETEIDKSIIEAMADPLVHMVRNSADHGIEPPDERSRKGKTEEGCIRLEAFNQGQYVVIRISDDGRGMDPGKIKLKALERGLANPDELEKMDEQKIFSLIFLPGFSMATEVSDVSGRGVGMDVVKTNIDKLGGDILVESKLGKGSSFTIKLPLTMAIGRGLEVEALDNRYYVPLEAIMETLRISAEKLFHYKGNEMIVIRDQLIPVYRLSERLGLTSQKGYNVRASKQKEALVILYVKGQRLGLLVDNYYNECEYVIKPLTGAISNIDGISGAMITGEGKVHLILDLHRLF